MNDMVKAPPKVSLVTKFADRYSIDPGKLMATLKATAFKQSSGNPVSDEQMAALLVVADQYHLNPFTREIYAFPDKQNGIVPVVGVDGWSRIINSHTQFNGMEYRYSDEMTTPDGAKSKCHEWVECVMYRKDRDKPVIVREYLDEVYRPPFKKTGQNGPYTVDGPWQTHPKRFLRHKATIQCARLAFGFVGIFDQDEAERIVERDMGAADVVRDEPRQLPECPADAFSKLLESVESGALGAEDAEAMASSRYTLTAEQAEQLCNAEPKGDEA